MRISKRTASGLLWALKALEPHLQADLEFAQGHFAVQCKWNLRRLRVLKEALEPSRCRCARCRQMLPVAEFNPKDSRPRKSWRHPYCRNCKREYQREWVEKNLGRKVKVKIP